MLKMYMLITNINEIKSHLAVLEESTLSTLFLNTLKCSLSALLIISNEKFTVKYILNCYV